MNIASSALVAAILSLAAMSVHPAQITVYAGGGVRPVLVALGAQFEKATQHKVVFQFGAAADLKARIDKGDAFDISILTAPLTDDLVKHGKVDPSTRATIAKSGAGVAIRAGAPKPDLSNSESFKRALLQAKSVALVGAGATGATMRRIFEQFGIADEMKAKTRVLSGVNPSDAVAKGDAELGFTQMSEIIGVPGVELAGPLPPEVQVYTVWSAAVNKDAKDAPAALAFIRFLTTPGAVLLIKAKGMEPGS